MNEFYLFPEDLGDHPSIYKCHHWKNVTLTDLEKKVWLVKISPALPDRIGNHLPNYEPNILGLIPIDESWYFSRIGEFGFIVDVLVVKDVNMVSEESESNAFSRFGTGVINNIPTKPHLKINTDASSDGC